MVRILLLLVALFFTNGVMSQENGVMRTFSLTPPTERTDGSALSPDEISKYEWGCSTTSGQYNILTFDALGGTTTSVQIPDSHMLPGVNYCSVRTVDTDGNKSEWANEATWINVAPPTDLGGGYQ